jgi:hypothetical protein
VKASKGQLDRSDSQERNRRLHCRSFNLPGTAGGRGDAMKKIFDAQIKDAKLVPIVSRDAGFSAP